MPASLPRRAASVVAATAALGLLGAAPATAHPAHGAEHHDHGAEHHKHRAEHRGHGAGHHKHGAGHWKHLDHVNLGDSYSAAIGTGGVAASPLGDVCQQGDGPDHVSALDAKPGVDLLLNAACAGFTAAQVRNFAASPTVTAALAEAELVTLTLGGNDVGWIQVIQACSLQGSPGTCDALIADTPRRIGIAAASAGETVAAIDESTSGEIIVLGYPPLFTPDPKSPLISPERAEQLNELTGELNDALEEAVEEDDAAEFVDVAHRFEGHGVDSDDPWIYLDPTNPENPNNLHPNESGYLYGYFAALKEELGHGHLWRH